MKPIFTLPTGYAERDMEFALTKDRKGWKFVGHADGYTVPARKPNGDLFFQGDALETRQDAAIMARALDFPPYKVWNGRKRKYDGIGEIIRAFPRV
jgi:hypothetical protein